MDSNGIDESGTLAPARSDDRFQVCDDIDTTVFERGGLEYTRRLLRNASLRTAATIVERDDLGPMRPVGRRRGGRPGGLYYSPKNGRHIGWESKVERNSMMKAEVSPIVLRYREQPHTIQIAGSGRAGVYTPDREDIYRDGTTVIVEVKDRFEEEADPHYSAKITRACEIYEALGWKFELLEREDVEAEPEFGVVTQIEHYKRVKFSSFEILMVKDALDGVVGTVAQLAGLFGSAPEANAKICSMAAAGLLEIDMDQPFGQETRVHIA